MNSIINGFAIWFNSRKTKSMLLSVGSTIYLYHSGGLTGLQAAIAIGAACGITILGTAGEDMVSKSSFKIETEQKPL